MTQRRRWLFVITASCILALAASCTDLTAVREWSKTSLEATQYNEIVTTYANTPERLKRYDSHGSYENQIADRKNQAEALKKILSTVSDYMAALAALSADGLVDYGQDVDSLKTSIGKLDPKISQTELGAVGTLAKDMLDAVAKEYQAKQVAKIVEEANGPLQLILRGELRKIVDQDFRRDLKSEKTWIDLFYNDLLREEGRPSKAAKEALKEWKEVRLEENAKRMAAVDAYVKVLDKVAEGHQKLYDNRNKLDDKTLIKNLCSLVVDLHKQITILAKS